MKKFLLFPFLCLSSFGFGLTGPSISGNPSGSGSSSSGGVTTNNSNLSYWLGTTIPASTSEGGPITFYDGTNWWLFTLGGSAGYGTYLQIGTNFNSLANVGTVIAPNTNSWDFGTAYAGGIWRENGTNYVPYNASPIVGDHPGQIGITYAPFGATNFVKYSGNPLLTTNSGIAWEAGGLYRSCLVKSGGTYFLYYNAYSSSSTEQIGFATSTNIFGPYTKYASNPVITNQSWCPVVCGDMNIIWDGQKWLMVYYTTSNGQGYFPAGMAWSLDLTNWTQMPNNPIHISDGGNVFMRPAWAVSNGVERLVYENNSGGLSVANPVSGATYTGGFQNGLDGSINLNQWNLLNIGGIWGGAGMAAMSVMSPTPYAPTALTILSKSNGSMTAAVSGNTNYIATEATRPLFIGHGGGAGALPKVADIVLDPASGIINLGTNTLVTKNKSSVFIPILLSDGAFAAANPANIFMGGNQFFADCLPINSGGSISVSPNFRQLVNGQFTNWIFEIDALITNMSLVTVTWTMRIGTNNTSGNYGGMYNPAPALTYQSLGSNVMKFIFSTNIPPAILTNMVSLQCNPSFSTSLSEPIYVLTSGCLTGTNSITGY